MRIAIAAIVLLASASAYACPSGTYQNRAGECVASPAWLYDATAICRDGYVSKARNFRGVCSRHGGVYLFVRNRKDK